MDPKFKQGYYVGYIFATVLYILMALFFTVMFPRECKADDVCDTVECLIASQAREQGVPVQVAIAVAKVESGLRQSAVGGAGELGLYQVRPEFTNANLRDLKTNIKEGVRILAYYKDHCPVKNGIEWVSCYNQGMKHPKFPLKLPYMKKILLAMKDIK